MRTILITQKVLFVSVIGSVLSFWYSV